MHAYRSHTCTELNAAHVGQGGAALGLGAPCARPRRRPVPRPARPLRYHPGDRRRRLAGLCRARDGAGRMGDPHRGPGEGARRVAGEPQARDRRDRGLCHRHECAGRGGRAAAAGVRRDRLSRGDAAHLPLPRPAAREAAPEHDAALERGAVLAQPDVGRGFQRVPDADHHRFLARGRARLSRAVAAPSGQVLCPAAGAAAVQAADHGGGLRPLLPDRALLPRRGPARRPLAHRLLPARHRDELRGAGRMCSRPCSR